MPLCTLCKSLPPLEEFHVFTHRTYKELQMSSAASQCDLCSMIWGTLNGLTSTEKILAEEPGKVSVILEYQGSAVYDRILVSPDIPIEAGATIELFTKRGEQTRNTIINKEIASSHNSHQTYGFIRGAIQDCLSNHKQCAKNMQVELPSFLIDLGTSHDQESVRLIHNDEMCRGTYLAMSYCWGGPQRVMLTTDTLLSFQAKLATSCLPEALRDAIYVTRELGHHYIWIDALCIIQDDDDFKQVELRKMNRIYQNAFLTIQPTQSDSVEKGFLDGRIITPHVKLRFTNGTQSYVYARRVIPASRENYGPTTKRAWIFQETALSTRLVVYNYRQAIVACQTQTRLESAGKEPNSFLGPGLHRLIRPDRYIPVGSRDATESRKAAFSGWYKAVGVWYSGRLYTVGKDRLYALSAFAEEAHQLIGGEYLAGLWSADLLRGLAWGHRNWRVLNKATQYRAPSWSWAALDGMVLWSTERSHIEPTSKETRVVEAWVKPEGINPYGPCLDGNLVLEALVGAASVSMKPWYEGKHITQGQFIMTTMNGTRDVCYAHFDTTEQPESFTCVFLTGQRGLLLATHGSSFRRIGTFILGDDFIKTSGTQGFQTWRDSCEYQMISIK